MKNDIVRVVKRTYALAWQRFNRAQNRFLIWKTRHGTLANWILLALLICISAFLAPNLQHYLESYLSEKSRFAAIRSLFLSLGSALIAAAAIAFSLIMFAMQVNVERMPHGLFRKLSTDKRIIASFAGTFLLAISIACASLIPEISWAAAAILWFVWGTTLIFLLFLYAYRRALVLINPLEQLNLIIKDNKREMKVWVRRARRATPLLQTVDSVPNLENGSAVSTHDLPRTSFFMLNPHWTSGAEKAIQYAISFARRFAEHGDHEVSAAALTTIVIINRNYVEAKGETFFANIPLVDNPLSTDGFINNTLELLRQNMRLGIARRDEQQIEQILQTMANLVVVYVMIDYSNKHDSKFHALLAASYLSDAVESMAPLNMADVLMEGIRLMGSSAHILLERDQPNSIVSLSEKIGLIACTGIANEKYRPVTLTAIEQLAKLTFALIRTDTHCISFASDKLKENIAMITKLFLKVPDDTLLGIQSTYLAPYYSSTTTQSLISWLTDLVNSLAETAQEDEAAKAIIRNIEDWADQLYQTQKDLLLLAIEKRSNFTFDIIHWTAHMTKLLLALSNAPACDDHTRDELRRHSLWLIATVSWIPDDKETIAFVENYRLTEILFEVAIDAYHRDCPKVFDEVQSLLLRWAFKGGRHQTGWAILERAIYGLATLALIENSVADENLKRQISDRLSQPDAPNPEIRNRTARDIRRRAAELYRQVHWSSRIESEMSRMDRAKMQTLLEELADLLSPDTADES